ncbi:MAG: hypothetical protein IH968_01720 [Gemmatimonadetes bacterium]|nr:hypothetical protein [Gemmatimonadota bacterium]
MGLYLGVGNFTQTREEIDQRLVSGGQPRKAKRHFMWLDYMRTTKPASARRAVRTHFRTAVSTKPAEKDRRDGDRV